MNALVVGATGYLGSTVSRSLARRCSVTGTFRSVSATGFADVRYRFPEDEFASVLDETDPEVVVFAASVEFDPDHPEAYERGVRDVASACADAGVRVIYVSSDAVFGGETGRYVESASPNPSTPYGRRLRLFEREIADGCTDYCIARPSYLYGYSPRGLDDRLSSTLRTVQTGNTVRYFEDMYKSPVAVGDAASALGSLATGSQTGIVHLPGPVRAFTGSTRRRWRRWEKTPRLFSQTGCPTTRTTPATPRSCRNGSKHCWILRSVPSGSLCGTVNP